MTYTIRDVVFRSGERYPVLLGEDLFPLWYPTLYCTTQRRSSSFAASTLTADLQAIRIFLNWQDAEKISFATRIRERPHNVLSPLEVESLAEILGRRLPPTDYQGSVVHLNHARAARGKGKQVEPDTKYNRLSSVSDFLRWYIPRLACDLRCETREIIDQARAISTRLKELRPGRSRFRRLGLRKGLSKESLKRLLTVIDPECTENPFSQELRRRNSLIVRMLLELGLRIGELLAVKVTDIDFRANEILIPRRADDPTDPRKKQPVAKTFDRRLPLSEKLVADIWDYISRDRRIFPRTKKHAFLLVVHAEGVFQGQPITSKGTDKVFAAIREADTKLLGALTAHVLRHTSNDLFSEVMDETKTKSGDEERQRSYKYGWKYGSGTAATYTKRHIEKAAQAASLKLQQHINRESQR